MDYHSYLQSEAWNQKRKKRLAKDKYRCQDCGVEGVPLHVHHRTYKRLGRERMSDLVSVCPSCHDARHGRYSILDRLRTSWSSL
jgi:5-methylcytosine-specific restriction endonuclease McrA